MILIEQFDAKVVKKALQNELGKIKFSKVGSSGKFYKLNMDSCDDKIPNEFRKKVVKA